MDILERVRAWMGEQSMLEDTQVLLCALSGGADSVCLLHLLRRLSGPLGFRLEAAHYHHGIRGGEADRDRDFVSALCREWNIPLHLGAGDAPAYARERGVGLEEAARELRYAFLKSAAGDLPECRVATAHQAEDQAETLLLNLCRGTGLRGLCGIPPVRGRFVRPLLVITREEILTYLEERGIPHVEDSTNALEDGPRNLLRHRVMPVLKQINPAFPKAVLGTAELLRGDEDCLSALAEGVPDYSQNGQVRYSATRLLSLPESLASRALRRGGEALGVRLERKHVAALLELAGGRGGLAGCDLPGGLRAAREFDLLRLYLPGALPGAWELPLEYGEWRRIPAVGKQVFWGPAAEAEKVHEKFQLFFFKNSHICGSIHVRSRRSGDLLRPAGRNRDISLKKWMMEERIPALDRDAVPVFADERGVVAVPGLGVAERVFAPAGEADGVLLLSERNENAGSQISGNTDQR